MTSNDYLYVYANDQEDRYHHLQTLDIAIKISRILSKRFAVKDIDKNRREIRQWAEWDKGKKLSDIEVETESFAEKLHKKILLGLIRISNLLNLIKWL